MKININRIFRTILEYLFVFFLILGGNTVLVRSVDFQNLEFLIDALIILTVVVLIILKRKVDLRNLKKAFIISSFISVYILFYSIINTINFIPLMKLFIMLIVFIFYIILYIENEFISIVLLKYRNAMICLCLLSLFFWSFGSILHVINTNTVIASRWVGGQRFIEYYNGYFNIHFEVQKIYGIMRNTGLFIEGPMYSFQLTLAFATELLLIRGKNKSIPIIIFVTQLTTFSLTGISLGLLIIFTRYFWADRNQSLEGKLIKIGLGLFVIIGLVYLIYNLFTIHRNSGSSSAIRFDDFVVGFRSWLESPIFGHGYLNIDALTKYMGSWRSHNLGYSNSVMYVLSQGGIYLGALYMYSFYRSLAISLHFRDRHTLLFILIILLLLVFTIMPYNNLTLLILVYFAIGF